jgi:hypothetical protein
VLVRVALKHNLTEHETGNVTLVSKQGTVRYLWVELLT